MERPLSVGKCCLLWACVAICACTESSQTVVYIHADPSLLPEARALRVSVWDHQDQLVLDDDINVDPFGGANDMGGRPELLATIPLEPKDGDATRTFRLMAELVDEPSSSSPLAVLRVAGGYEASAQRVIHVWFDDTPECLAIGDCGLGRTCVNGRCLGSCFAGLDPDPLGNGESIRRTLPECNECQQCRQQRCDELGDGTECSCGGSCTDGLCSVGPTTRGVWTSDQTTCSDTGNSLHCWGNDYARRTGTGGSTDVPDEVLLNGNSVVWPTVASLGGESGCAIYLEDPGGLTQQRRICWGWSSDVGLGAGGMVLEPTLADEELRFDSLAAGWFHHCGVADGELYCWGSNNKLQLALPEEEDEALSPHRIELPGPARIVSPARESTCVLLQDGEVYCWGAGEAGELGNGMQGPTANISCVTSEDGECIDDFVFLSCGGGFTCCGLREAGSEPNVGTMWCWGGNRDNRVGPGPQELLHPTPVADGFLWKSVSVRDTVCGIRVESADEPSPEAGELYCWGYGGAGQVGVGDRLARLEPTRVQAESGDRFRSVSCGPGYNCAIREDLTLWCWGSNDGGSVVIDSASGRLGLGLGSFNLEGIACGDDDPCPDGRMCTEEGMCTFTEPELRSRTDVLWPRRVCF